MNQNSINKQEVVKREMLLLALIAAHTAKIAARYPATRPHFEDMQTDIIALTIDWD